MYKMIQSLVWSYEIAIEGPSKPFIIRPIFRLSSILLTEVTNLRSYIGTRTYQTLPNIHND